MLACGRDDGVDDVVAAVAVEAPGGLERDLVRSHARSPGSAFASPTIDGGLQVAGPTGWARGVRTGPLRRLRRHLPRERGRIGWGACDLPGELGEVREVREPTLVSDFLKDWTYKPAKINASHDLKGWTRP